ncbi:MAG: hypothetical protein EP329_11470 [Deltaproteobacteria bacterium]|nr:MAG: hypothetical protein EP329_11470 [Deltaproteobacteria bacterium]
MKLIASVFASALGLALLACPSPEVRPAPTPDETVEATDPPETTPAPTPKPKPTVDPARKEELQREYRKLALKNDCSGAFKHLDGTWRFIGQSRTPNHTDVLTIQGTKFTEKLTGDPDGKHLEADLSGEIRCLFKNRVLMMIDKVVPEGAYENHSGDQYPCDVLGDIAMTGNKMLLICYYDWDLRTAAGIESEFERVVE